jgi:hypothetical protein
LERLGIDMKAVW